MFNIVLSSGTGSNQYQPASGSSADSPYLRVETLTDNYSGSGLYQPLSKFNVPKPEGMFDHGAGMAWLPNATRTYQTFRGGANSGPEDRWLSCSFHAVLNDDHSITDDFYFTVQQEALNGASVSPVSLARGTTKFTASVFYWALDSADEILEPVTGSVWRIAGQNVVSSSTEYNGERYTIEYYFTGSQNTGTSPRSETVHFYTSNSRKFYVSDTGMTITQEGDTRPNELYVPGDGPYPRPTFEGDSLDFVLEKNGEVVLEDTLYQKPGVTSSVVNLGEFVDPYLETKPISSLLYYPDVFTLTDGQGNVLGPAAYIPAKTSFVHYPGIDEDYYSLSEFFTRKWAPGRSLYATVFNGSEDNLVKRVSMQPDAGSTGTFSLQPGQIGHVRSFTNCNMSSLTLQFLDDEYQVDQWVWDEKVDNFTYVLYWINPDRGGLQQFPFTGRMVDFRTAERYSIINPRLYKYNYKRGIERGYHLSTGLLWEEIESRWMMDNIFRSPLVCLDGIGNRVRIDMNSIDLKTFRNQGRTVPEYEFDVVYCQQEVTK